MCTFSIYNKLPIWQIAGAIGCAVFELSYIFVPHHYKLLGTTLTNQNFIHKKIKSRLNSGNACYHSRLLSKYIKMKIYRTIILSVLFSGCETWSLILTVEHRMTVFEKRELRKIFGSKREDLIGDCRRLHKKELHDLCFFFTANNSPLVGQGLLTVQASRSNSVTHTTLGRTPLDEWSARRRDLYLTTHDTHKRQPSMQPAGFEPTIPANERPQTHALERATAGINDLCSLSTIIRVIKSKKMW